MKLADHLRQNRETIIEKWFDAVAECYPSDTARLLQNQKDRFNNPVGHTLRERLPVLFDALLGDATDGDLDPAIDDILKIRTVQADTPSQAVAFVFLLKRVVRDALAEFRDGDVGDEPGEFETRIDGLALKAFDQYMVCRERIFEIRTREVKMRSALLVEQVNKLYGGVDKPPTSQE